MKTIPYRIAKIETLQFAIFPDKYINGQEVMVTTNYGFNIKTDLKQIRNIVTVSYTQDNNLLLVMELACYFDIAPEGTKAIDEAGIVPVEFMRYIAAITTGTARGVIHAKTEGTVLGHVIMPPVDLTKVIKGDMKINRPENGRDFENSSLCSDLQ